MTRAVDIALLAAVTEIARAAGEAILAVYRGEFAVERKADRSPLTAADIAAHRLISAELARLTPDWPILSEESASIPWATRRAWRRYWLVDPLDGTREFVKRNGEFCVNVALIDDGRAVLGVIHGPVLDETAAAIVGAPPRIERAGHALALADRCAAQPPLPRVAGSRSHRDPRMTAALAALGDHALLAQGSALKFIRLASGEADLYLRLGPTSEWDTAAGQCIVEAAGGEVVDLDGRALVYNARDSLLNGDFIASGDARINWRARLGLAS